MAVKQRTAEVGAIAMALCATSLPASAHHVMGGQMPSTLVQGLLSGLGHPIIGVDHLLFIIGVGLLAGALGNRLLVPLAFVLGTLAGAAAHLAGLSIAFAEWAILASVALMAVAVFSRMRLSTPSAAGLLALAGLFHGYAYAESIFGAEPTPLYAYLAGFAVIQFAIAFAAATAYRMLDTYQHALARPAMRIAGGVMAAFVLVALGQMTVGA